MEAFENAGTEPGIEIWTIEQFEPVVVNTSKYGKFYNGDTYIVLKTTGDSNSGMSYDAHFWLGSKSSQDKRGAAAIWTVTLDDHLSGRAVHHREPQGYESPAFLGYFKPAIRYMEGGNESGFTEVEINAGAEKRLLKLSGCDNMRIEEVPADASSLSKNHCFILENEHDIFVLMPDDAKATHRRKIISVANSLRDDYHNGRATIEIIDEFSPDEDFELFFGTLGSGSRDELVDGEVAETHYRDDLCAVYLSRVVFGDDLSFVDLSKPYKQNHLTEDEVYILDTPDSGIYIWIGSNVAQEINKNYMNIINQYLDVKSYPNWVNITKMYQHSESATFKQYFHDWETLPQDTIKAFSNEIDAGYSSDDTSAIAKLIGKSAAARGYMPDLGDGNLTIIRVSDEEDVSDQSVLYQSEVYIVKYQYTNGNGEDAVVVYTWTGALSSDDDREAARQLVSQIEDEVSTNLTLVKIPQGNEMKHFLKLFKGNLAIVCGNKDDGYKPENFNGNYDDNNIRLFRVEGTALEVDMRAVQLPERSDVLENDDVFILETAEVVYIRNGSESSEIELEAAKIFAATLIGDEKSLEVIDQGSEPEAFWEILGSLPDDISFPSGWTLAVSRRVNTPTTLTDVTVKHSGKILFEDLDSTYTQQDLSDDGVYILDTGEELYLWQGVNLHHRAVEARESVIQKYIEDDGLDRTYETALVVVVRQGAEPDVFKKLFPAWDDHMWENLTSYEDMKNETKAANSY